MLMCGTWPAPSIVMRSACGSGSASISTTGRKKGALSVPLVKSAGRLIARQATQLYLERVGVARFVESGWRVGDEHGAHLRVEGCCITVTAGREGPATDDALAFLIATAAQL
jgi:hypothetical protein